MATTIERNEAVGATLPTTESRVGRDDGDQWAVLAGLRFLLALIVMLGHVKLFVAFPTSLSLISGISAYQAVFVFFGISGYSISASLERSREGFYQRRFERIYPTYFVGMLLAVLPFLLWGPVVNSGNYHAEATATPWPVVANFFLLQGIITPQAVPTFGQSWSLAVECIIYVFAPFLCRLRDRSLILILTFSIIVWIKDCSSSPLMPAPFSYGLPAIGCLWAWLIGVLIYRHKASVIWSWMLAALLLYAMGVHDTSTYPTSPAFILVAFGVLCYCTNITLPVWLRRPLLYLGELSLSMYLIHFQIFCLIAHRFPEIPLFLIIACTLAAAVLTLHFVDFPYRAYVKKISIRRTSEKVMNHV